MMGPQHLVPALHLLLRLVHQCVLVPSRVQLSQELCINEFLHLPKVQYSLYMLYIYIAHTLKMSDSMYL